MHGPAAACRNRDEWPDEREISSRYFSDIEYTIISCIKIKKEQKKKGKVYYTAYTQLGGCIEREREREGPTPGS